jgi:hypothetical protein
MFDTVSFSVEAEGTTWPDQVVIWINGTDLLTIACEAGLDDEGYTGPPQLVIAKHPDHLLGGPDRWEDATDPFYPDPALLGCGCGAPGCAAVLVQIDLDEDAVTWSNFRRDRNKGRLNIGPYRFDRQKYAEAVRELRGP